MLFRELHDAADDRNFVALTDAFELPLAEKVLDGVAAGVIRALHRLGLPAAARDEPAESRVRPRHELERAENREHEWREHRRPTARDRARDDLAQDNDEDCEGDKSRNDPPRRRL